MGYVVFFFFSSRRRHTRWTGDWSSDVCSSDLWGAAILLCLAACQQKPAQLTYEGAEYKTDAQKIAHGKRLADIVGCTDCHRANLEGGNVGGKPENGPMYAPNI